MMKRLLLGITLLLALGLPLQAQEEEQSPHDIAQQRIEEAAASNATGLDLSEQQSPESAIALILQKGLTPLNFLLAVFEAVGKAKEFTELKVFITPYSDEVKMAAVAERLHMSDGAVRVAAHRLKKRYRKVLREEIAKTVASADDVEDEIRGLFAAFDD